MAKAPRFIGKHERSRVVTLEWPLEYDGREYRKIHIVRLTASEVAKFQEEIIALLERDKNARIRFPLYRDADGGLIPDEVMDALDDDDKVVLEEAAMTFLPRRYRDAMSASTQPSGDNIERSSAG